MGRIADFFSLLFICIPCKAKKNKVVPFATNRVNDDSIPNAAVRIPPNDDKSGNPSSSRSLHCAAAAGNKYSFPCRIKQAQEYTSAKVNVHVRYSHDGDYYLYARHLKVLNISIYASLDATY